MAPRRLLTLLVTVLTFSWSCLGQTAQSPPAPGPEIVEGTMTSTAAGGGKWQAWFNAAGATILCGNRDAIWFGKACNVWRYNVAKKQVDVFTSPLSQPELTDFSPKVSLCSDGRMAMGCRNAILLWDGKEWSRLPQPAGDRNAQFMSFSGKGELWAVDYNRAYRWEGTRWSLMVKVPQNTGIWALGEKWFMWNNFGQGKAWKTYTVWDGALKDSQEYPPLDQRYMFTGRMFYTTGGAMGLFWPSTVCQVTDKGITEKLRGDNIVLDLVSGQAFTALPQAQGGRLEIKSADGAVAALLPPLAADLMKPQYHYELLRDANGHYWFGHWRCDGKSWQAVLPPNAFQFTGVGLSGAIIGGRLKYDTAKDAWTDTTPELPTMMGAWDAAARTGWIVRPGAKFSTEPTTSEKFHFAADGTRTRLASVTAGPLKFQQPGVRFELGNDVWLSGVYRWDGQKMHYYDNGWAGRSSPKEGSPQLLLSPKKNVWMLHTNRTWQKYNPQTDRFEEGSPFDDYQFTVGEMTLSIVGTMGDRSWGSSGNMGSIHVKEAGEWKPLPYPFVSGAGGGWVDYSRAPLSAVPGRFVRNGRMIVTCAQGVFEQDLKSHRWAFLAPQNNVWAFFDDAGRRVIVGNDSMGQVLVYEGDPLGAEAKPATPANPLEARIKALLVGMDSDKWKDREDATREAINLIRKNPKEVAAVLEKPDLARNYSPEVKSRVEIVLKECSPGEPAAPAGPGSYEGQRVAAARTVGNSLLERMHPPMAPKIDYTIKPGMELEHAKAVFVAAGALEAYEILNAHSGDRSYQGYLLPDNTMVYVRLANADGTGAIRTIGLGVAGKGNDKAWDWQDTTKNSLQALELKPNRARSAE